MKVSDFHFAVGGLGLMAVVGAIYLARSARKGRARHARTDADGGSVFLGKPVMEFGVWLIEPLVDTLATWRVTPATVTLVSLVPALCAGLAIARGWFALAALLGWAAAVCDILDGMLARRVGVASAAGEALDAAVDRYTEFMFLAGIAVYYRTNVTCLLLTLAALFGSFMVSYTTAKAEALNVAVPRGYMRRPERTVYLLVGAGFTAFTKALWDDSSSLVLRELPIIFSLFLVATVTNISTVTRLRALMDTLRARHPAPPEDVAEDVAGPLSKTPAGLG
jgi:phosphatidylglycerophosphate synthase